MKYNEHFYPYIPDVDMYPVYLTGVGGSEYQEHVTRLEGYYWHQILFCAAGKGKLNILLPVIAYIEENIGNDFPITELAGIAGISHQHLCRLFKDIFNNKPNEYVANRRVAYAKKLISDSTLSIKEISEKAGFINESYFSTVFRKIEGISPNEFRKNLHR